MTSLGRARDMSVIVVLTFMLLGLATYRLAHAETSANKPATDAKLDTTLLNKKLDHILANQETILQKLEAMAQELQVVKVRSTH